MSATVSGSAFDVAAWLPVNSASPPFFSGARGVPPIASDYASALTVALSVPAWTVFCDSNLPAVQALMASHCEIASVPAERRFLASWLYRILNWRQHFVYRGCFDQPRYDHAVMVYAYPGYLPDQYLDGRFTALWRLVCGRSRRWCAWRTGNQIAMPLTNKVLTGNGGVETG